ncbi:hypothetical protein PybrP1_007670 [[Pythium] brassicae (nom. inval.)]|nr:hypothetical protein PybrP1_007670 [[Pythium] brassicae (nom. inval.)]
MLSPAMSSSALAVGSASSAEDLDASDQVHVPSEYRALYWLFAVAGVVLLYYSVGYAKKYCTMAAFLLPPFIICCIVFDNVVMATTGMNHREASVQTMLAFHACVTPMILLVCYEIAYLVHKQKSVNFCGISFESGHRRHGGGGGNSNERPVLSTLLRFAVWMVSIGLLVLNLLAAYKWSGENAPPEIRSIYDLEGDSTAHALFSLLPALVLVALSLYIGLQLWNYGTFYSYMVHATCFNPWIWMLVGSVSLLTGYLLPSPIYALSSNAGELIMMATIVRMFREVHHDMQQDQQMRTFIDPIQTVSPQEQTASDMSASQSHASHASHGGKHEVHSTTGARPAGANDGAESDAYLEVATPKESEVRLTDADGHGHATNFLSVVVASSRTNPLFSSSS